MSGKGLKRANTCAIIYFNSRFLNPALGNKLFSRIIVTFFTQYGITFQSVQFEMNTEER